MCRDKVVQLAVPALRNLSSLASTDNQHPPLRMWCRPRGNSKIHELTVKSDRRVSPEFGGSNSPESIATAARQSMSKSRAAHQEAMGSLTGWHKYVVTGARTKMLPSGDAGELVLPHFFLSKRAGPWPRSFPLFDWSSGVFVFTLSAPTPGGLGVTVGLFQSFLGENYSDVDSAATRKSIECPEERVRSKYHLQISSFTTRGPLTGRQVNA